MTILRLHDDYLKDIELHVDQYSIAVINTKVGKQKKDKDGNLLFNDDGTPKPADPVNYGYYSWFENALTKTYQKVTARKNKMKLSEYINKYVEVVNKFNDLNIKNFNELLDLQPVVQENKKLKEKIKELKKEIKKLKG